jgi:hypothetical protein
MQAQRMRKIWHKMQDESGERKERVQAVSKKVPYLPKIDKMKISS